MGGLARSMSRFPTNWDVISFLVVNEIREHLNAFDSIRIQLIANKGSKTKLHHDNTNGIHVAGSSSYYGHCDLKIPFLPPLQMVAFLRPRMFVKTPDNFEMAIALCQIDSCFTIIVLLIQIQLLVFQQFDNSIGMANKACE